jgi:hypothetical protein
METYHKYTTEPSPLDERDFVARDIYPERDLISLPKKLDLRDNLRAIRNQGEQGICSGMTVECMKEWQEKIDIGQTDYLSPQFVYNLRKNYNSEGMYGRDAMDILLKHGIPREYYYQYGKIETPDDISDEVYQDAANFKIKGYARVDTIADCKRALFKNGPCYISLPVYNHGRTFWKPQNVGDKKQGGHAVTIVGYDDKARHFILRNSWGLLWGEFGYGYLPYDEWGMQWESWTAIDEKSSVPLPVPKRNIFTRLFSFSCMKK